MQFHDIAVEVARREGGAINVSIAQISEVLRHAFDVMAEVNETEILLALRKRKKEISKGALSNAVAASDVQTTSESAVG